MRRQGIYNESLPTKKSQNIVPSDFLIAGLIGIAERRYKNTYTVRNMKEYQTIFGVDFSSSYYMFEQAQLFFQNAVGVDAKLIAKSHVGYTGSAYDGVSATLSAVDGAATPLLKFESAYLTDLDYSTYGNNTGYTIETGDRFATTVKTTGAAADTFVILTSVAGIKIGDILKVVATGGGGATVYQSVTAIDESTGKVSFAGAFHGTANAAATDVATIPGFKVHTWRKSATGLVAEVDTDLGKLWCTTEAAVTDYHVEKVFANSKYVKITDLDPATALANRMPAAVSTVTYLASGANGTAPTTSAHWGGDLSAFDSTDIRMAANCETTDVTTQKALETYMRGRVKTDLPKVIGNIAEGQTKAQLIVIGNNYQRSDDVLMINFGYWLKIQDPFSTSNLAPARVVPNVGAIMGAWCRSIGTLGIHQIPAQDQIPLYGVLDVDRPEILGDLDRTDLCAAGINLIDNVTGTGIVMKSFYTSSTTKEFSFGNGILMREFLKASVKSSLSSTVNEPNTYLRMQSSRSAVLKFMNQLWLHGSSGNVPTGETFGQTFDATTGQASKFEDHVQVQADFINNPQANIEAGERNIDTYFSYPAPAASIKIGVGLLLLG